MTELNVNHDLDKLVGDLLASRVDDSVGRELHRGAVANRRRVEASPKLSTLVTNGDFLQARYPEGQSKLI